MTTPGPQIIPTEWTPRVVAIACTLRSDWDENGVRRILATLAEHPLADVIAAVTAAASNPGARTPAAITWAQHWPGSGPTTDSTDPHHWAGRCDTHGGTLTDDGRCRDCEAIRKGVDPDTPQSDRCRLRDCLVHGVGKYAEPTRRPETDR